MRLIDADELIDELMDEGTDFEKMTPGDLVDEILRLADKRELETEKAVDGLLEEIDGLHKTIADLRKINAELADGYHAEEDAAHKNERKQRERSDWVEYGKAKGMEQAIGVILEYFTEEVRNR